MIDWSSDPEFAQIRQEFVCSLEDRLAKVRHLCAQKGAGQLTQEELIAVQCLAHKLAGSAGSYGFFALSQIAGELDDLFSGEGQVLEPSRLGPLLSHLEEALTSVVEALPG